MTRTRLVQAVVPLVHQAVTEHFAAPSAWRDLRETQLWEELVACILGSQVTYESATAFTRHLKALTLLDASPRLLNSPTYRGAVEAALATPLPHPRDRRRTLRYRFPRKRAEYIHRSGLALYRMGDGIKSLLRDAGSARDARRCICNTAAGIGPKQASLFLRNIGYTSELAILDSQVLRYMHESGCLPHAVVAPSTIRQYEKHERLFVEHVAAFGYPPGCVDRTIWFVMRVATKWGLK